MRTRRPAAAALAAALLALAGCGGGGDATPEADVPQTETEPVVDAFAQDEVEVAIEDQQTNELIGTALLTPEGDAATRVLVRLDVYPEGGGSAEIRRGRCDEPGAEVAHEVGTLEEGETEGTAETTLDDLLAADHAMWAVGPDDRDLGCALIAPFSP